ncbi:MAG: hypothetical protein AAB540_02900 [Patescibacteria group bacterium]
MRKFVIAVIFIVIIVITVLAVRNCEPRKKVLETEADVYSAFINANIEFTCELIKDPLLDAVEEEAKSKVNEIYAKHKLPVDDDQKMVEILQKYENDPEVIAIIRENTKPCELDQSPIFYKSE